MSWRWPLRATRGFSATPRRGFTQSRGLMRAPSKQAARRVVRRAGPQQSAFFCNSNLVSAGTVPATYASPGQFRSIQVFTLFDAGDWATSTVSNRAKCLIKKLTYKAYLHSVNGTSDLGFEAFFNTTLLIGRPDDITDDVLTPLAFPWGEQSSLVAFQDLSRRTVRFRARKQFNMFIPGIYANADSSEVLLSNLVGRDRTTRVITLTLRNVWVGQNEIVRVLFDHIKDGLSTDNVSASGAVTGWHNTLIQYATH